jgi:hypothetical protein
MPAQLSDLSDELRRGSNKTRGHFNLIRSDNLAHTTYLLNRITGALVG